MTTHYKLRTVIINDEAIERICSYTTGVYAYSFEKATRMHMHWFLELEKGEAGLRKILREIGLKGNSGYSLKALDELYPIEYLAYLLKDNTDVKMVGIPDDIITTARDYDLKIKADMKKKERKVWKVILDKLIEEGKTDVTQRELAILVLDYHKENDLLIRSHMLTTYVDTIHFKLAVHRSDLPCIRLYSEAIASNTILVKYNDLKNRR